MSLSLRDAPVWALVACAALRANEAAACGGCAHPPPPPMMELPQVITDHRMVVAMHTGETVLWDQVRFSGAAREFAWIMPVSGPVRVEVGDALFVEQIAQLTNPVVLEPQATCDQVTGMVTVRPADPRPAVIGGDELTDVVTVLQAQVVGPYEVAVIHGADPTAITEWMRSNGYQLTPDIDAPIAYYTALRSDFVVARLRPGEGVGAIQPIRIRFPGTVTRLPLRMIAAGVADTVGIELYVIGAGRWDVSGFPTATVNGFNVVWDYARGRSNYADAFRWAVLRSGNAGWVTEFAGRLALPVDRTGSAAAEWALAMGDMHEPWITRIRTELPRASLDTDLQFGAVDDGEVSLTVPAQRWVNLPRVRCSDGGVAVITRFDGGVRVGDAGISYGVILPQPGPGCACSAAREPAGGGAMAVWGLLGLCALGSRRRRPAG